MLEGARESNNPDRTLPKRSKVASPKTCKKDATDKAYHLKIVAQDALAMETPCHQTR